LLDEVKNVLRRETCGRVENNGSSFVTDLYINGNCWIWRSDASL